MKEPPAGSPALDPVDESRDRLPPAMLVGWGSIVAVLVVLNLAANYLADSASDPDDRPAFFFYSTTVYSLVQFGLILVLTLWLASKDPRGIREGCGLRRFRASALGLAAGAIVVTVVIGAVLEPVLKAGEKQGLAPDSWDPDYAGPIVLNSLIAITIVPFVEELFFRGLGVRVTRAWGAGAAIAITAVLFGLAHGIPEALPPLVAFAVVLAYIRVRSGSIWPTIIGHGAYNGIAIAASLAA